MTRERASGPGDGDPASGSSPPPSVYPEPPVGERGDRVPAAPDHFVPRWQEFADAVWLAAHRSRYARPCDEDRPAAAVDTERPQDAETEQPPPPPADDGAFLDRPIGLWALFALIVLAFDLGILHRRAHEIRLSESLLLSGAYVAIGA